MSYFRHKIVRIWLSIFLFSMMSCALAADQEVRIGVLSFRPLDQTNLQWQPTAAYLTEHVPGYHFSVVTLHYKELDLAINRHDFDFVLTNPEHYVTVRTDHGLTAIATLMPLAEGHPVTQFGGVILARADRSDINTLEDVRGKIVSSPAEQSLGGYLMQRWALYKQGVGIADFKHLQFTGMPHDNVVMEVLNHNADVGFVRTGILENMAREGKVKLEQFKVLNRQPESSFPQVYSTDLYPEWPFAAMPSVSEPLVKKVTLALLNIQPSEAAAQQGKFFGFSPGGNYSSVEAMMARLKVNPERASEFSLRDVSRKYALELMVVGALLFLSMVATAIFFARKNRQLLQSNVERDTLGEELKRVNASLEITVMQRTAALEKSEASFRNMFERHSSPMLLIEPQSGLIVSANLAASQFYGYSTDELQTMKIEQINAKSPDEIAVERAQAQQEVRNYFIFSHRLANGEVRTVEVYSSPVDVEGRSLLFSIVHDITQRKELEVQMHDLAFYDALTKLPNRRLLLDRLEQALVSCLRTHRHGALLFLDLDHFKTLNDLHGHDLGDQLLIEVGLRISTCIREEDSAARFGGDEFVVMLENLSSDMHEAVIQAELVSEKIRASLAQPYILRRSAGAGDVITHRCTSSIGVTVFSDHEESLEQLLKWTDMAMYRAKEAGRNAIRFFDPVMQTAIENRAALESELHDALKLGQFKLFYQIQVNAHGSAQGAEVLLRWLHPVRGMVSPAQFIPLAEETGLILPIGAWVLETACAQIQKWQNQAVFRNLSLAVNVSAKQFRQTDFVDQVKAVVARYKINPVLLKLELTESLVLEDVEGTIAKMRILKDFGINFSMDDFGTGYSSLSYLKRLPLSQLKIDQSFVRNLATDAGDKVMVMMIADLGMNFEVDVIAEGVETEAQFKLLHRYGCAFFQGYLFSKPVPVEEFEALVVNKMRK